MTALLLARADSAMPAVLEEPLHYPALAIGVVGVVILAWGVLCGP